jgi:predicted nucleotidyltransferase
MSTPVSEEIRSLLAKTYGPLAALREAFADQPVTYVGVYGSFAARWRGEQGPPPNDIDLLVVGDLDYESLWDITASVSRDLGIEINAVLRTPGSWADDDSPFADAVRGGHLVDVIGDEPSAEHGAGTDG